MISEKNNLNNWCSVDAPGPVVLPGQWVTLEPLSAERHTKGLWHSLAGHDSVWAWMTDGPYASEQALSDALTAKELGTAAQFFAIVPQAISGAVEEAKGYASLMRIDVANGVVEVGNVMFSPALQRTPAATEAMYLMARYVFEELGYRRYEWKCNAQNLPSQRAAVRFGFTYEGLFRQHMVVKGQNRNTAWYSMLDSEWPVRKQAFEAWLAPGNFDAVSQQKRTLASFSSTL